MPLYRCANCGNEAEHAAPKCEPCGLDPKADPRDAQLLIELVTIHFDPPHAKVTGRGLGHAACDASKKVGRGPDRFTGERDVVNCAACKASEPFNAAAGVAPMPQDRANRMAKVALGQALKAAPPT